MFRAHTPIIRSIRCWAAAYGFLHRVFGWWTYVPETCRAKNALIKPPCCIKLAVQIISWGRCTVKQPPSNWVLFKTFDVVISCNVLLRVAKFWTNWVFCISELRNMLLILRCHVKFIETWTVICKICHYLQGMPLFARYAIIWFQYSSLNLQVGSECFLRTRENPDCISKFINSTCDFLTR